MIIWSVVSCFLDICSQDTYRDSRLPSQSTRSMHFTSFSRHTHLRCFGDLLGGLRVDATCVSLLLMRSCGSCVFVGGGGVGAGGLYGCVGDVRFGRGVVWSWVGGWVVLLDDCWGLG